VKTKSKKKSEEPKLPRTFAYGVWCFALGVALPLIGATYNDTGKNFDELQRAFITAAVLSSGVLAIPAASLLLLGLDPKQFCTTHWWVFRHALFGIWIGVCIFLCLHGFERAGPWFLPMYAAVLCIGGLFLVPIGQCRLYYLKHPNG